MKPSRELKNEMSSHLILTGAYFTLIFLGGKKNYFLNLSLLPISPGVFFSHPQFHANFL